MTPADLSGCHGRQRGIVLAMVLWLLMLMTLLAGSYTVSTRTEVALTARLNLAAQARAIAEAGLWAAARELARPPAPARWPAAGDVHEFDFGGGTATVWLQDESGKIDVNSARPELLFRLLLSAGNGDENRAQALLQAILDWRDADDTRRRMGAESMDYDAEGAAYLPGNGPFTAVDELRLILGMDDRIYRRLEPAITVYSGQSGVNAEVAVREALLALPDVSRQQVDEYIVRRSASGGVGDGVPEWVDSRFNSEPRRRVITILSEGQVADVRVTVEAVVRFNAGTASPVSILSWREGSVPRSASTGGT